MNTYFRVWVIGFTFCIISLTQFTGVAQSCDILFRKGKTSYNIVVSSEASVTEKTAAEELKYYLGQISGADFKLTCVPGRKNIYVGYAEEYAIFNGIEPYQDCSEGFTVKKIDHDLVIYGGKDRGTMFGVFRFLQKYFGVQWYTPDFTKTPNMSRFIIPNIVFSEEPKIKYRYTDFYCTQNISWLAHNMMNISQSNIPNGYGISSRYWGAHTFSQLLPADIYFETHPEYFAYRNNKRLENGQPCLSNSDVLKIVTERLMSVIEKKPNYLFYDVSQLDNYYYCTCQSCVELEKKYGGHSGLMIWFVNQVAREVKKKYPEKYIGTFAYQYTRKAPVNIKPDDNVVIRLCDIECCFTHPLASKCNEKNVAFMQDLEEWSKITKNLYIWDYIVNYSNFLVPFPNIQVLGPNLKTFSEYEVIEVFEEAQNSTFGNAFEELKSWVVTQLMWNPDQNTEELVAQFVCDYYGGASNDILDYYNLCNSLINENSHMTCFSDPTKAPYTDEFNNEAYRILYRALENSGNEIIAERVQKVLLQPMALECVRHPNDFFNQGKWADFKSQILKYNAWITSHVSSKMFIESFESKINF